MAPLPNIIMLMLDTARAQNFSCYGYPRPTTPHIDALAAEGTLYEQTIATGCWSLPSQVSLLSGLFPSKHGAHELHLSYDHSYPLLPEILRQAGYRTLGISPNGWMSDEFGVTHGFDTYLKLWELWPIRPAFRATAPTALTTAARKVNQWYYRHLFSYRDQARRVTQHIRKLMATAAQPFFVYAIYWDVHLPYYPRGSHRTRWLPAGLTYPQARRVNRNSLRFFADQAPMSEEDFDILRACYDGALATIDEEVGILVAELRQQGLLDRTLLVITSDHGENIGEHGLMSHAYSLHDTLIRVPLIVRYPDCFRPGQRITYQVQLTDLFPTVLDVCQLEVPTVRAELQGLSLLSPEPDAMAERLAYAEMLAPHPSMRTVNRAGGLPEDTPRPAYERALRCLRTPEYKLIWASDGQHALYDLHDDPAETMNRFAQESELAGKLLEALHAWQPPSDSLLRGTKPHLDADVRQRLRDLGYLA